MLWPDAFLSLQTCEKIVLFLNFEMADVSRTFWRRCPTPEGQSSAAMREMPAIQKPGNSRFLKRPVWEEGNVAPARIFGGQALCRQPFYLYPFHNPKTKGFKERENMIQ